MRRFDCQTVEGISMMIQVNGKQRARVEVPRGSSVETVQNAAMEHYEFRVAIRDKAIVRVVFAPDRVFNIIVK